eukprot:gb/GECG01005568.1/.p1 GENE.gb/GECG01005568.1/~~gb/GECG01005568.1/.p1  ORF type:complete len:220 (+),score=26.47 gb/GECG01005568.1/:1-660(+)
MEGVFTKVQQITGMEPAAKQQVQPRQSSGRRPSTRGASLNLHADPKASRPRLLTAPIRLGEPPPPKSTRNIDSAVVASTGQFRLKKDTLPAGRSTPAKTEMAEYCEMDKQSLHRDEWSNPPVEKPDEYESLTREPSSASSGRLSTEPETAIDVKHYSSGSFQSKFGAPALESPHATSSDANLIALANAANARGAGAGMKYVGWKKPGAGTFGIFTCFMF